MAHISISTNPLRLRVVEHPHICPNLERRVVIFQESGLAIRQNARGIPRQHGSLVWVCAIGNQLHCRLAVVLQMRGKIPAEDQHQVNVSSLEYVIDLLRAGQLLRQDKILACRKMFLDAPGLRIFRRVEHSKPRIPYLRLDGIPQKQHLHHRHDQQNKHGAPVAEYLPELFYYK